MKNRDKHTTLKTIQLTLQEWFDALKTPSPRRNKKRYTRKDKHNKNKDY